TGAPTRPQYTAELDRRGLSAAVAAFLIWGSMPLYVKALGDVSAFQIAAHRLVWGCVFAFAWLALRGELGQVRRALATPDIRRRRGRGQPRLLHRSAAEYPDRCAVSVRAPQPGAMAGRRDRQRRGDLSHLGRRTAALDCADPGTGIRPVWTGAQSGGSGCAGW